MRYGVSLLLGKTSIHEDLRGGIKMEEFSFRMSVSSEDDEDSDGGDGESDDEDLY